MSVTFSIEGDSPNWDDPEEAEDFERHRSMNLSNMNARNLLAWLDIDADDLFGAMPGRELAARARRRLWPEKRNIDPKLIPEESGGPGTGHARLIFGGRPEGYLQERTEQLLAIAKLADDLDVVWG